MNHEFSESEKAAFYRAVFERRDCRRFRPEPIPEPTLGRILEAAHHAPSVGFMQPWDFIIIRDEEIRREVYENFERSNRDAARIYDSAQHKLYESLKLQGILRAPVNICVTCDRQRT